ncbi:MAG: hypothetical protein ABIY50_09860 [Ignavibacteria bacterium]
MERSSAIILNIKLVIMFENISQPIASQKVFISRVFKSIVGGMMMLLFCLIVGMFGYHELGIYCGSIHF